MARKNPGKGPRRGLENRFRIIGGRWRGRKLSFPPLQGLRPSPDRVRESVFNWLAPLIDGARCLDLFAGSGALGLEAISRGASRVVMVDRERGSVEALRAHLALLGDESSEVVQADAFAYLATPGPRFDIVFLDPPFDRNLLPRLCKLLSETGRLAPAARIYLECEASLGEPPLPPGWTLLRSRRAGRVGYHLALFGETTEN